jgi:hypothetical protein
MNIPDLETRIAAELALGGASAASNPGKARVCARRAAGWAIQAWYQAREGPGWSGDAMKQLNRLRTDPAVPQAPRAAAERLSTKVDREHRLPFEEDALDDASLIVEWALASGDGGR